MKQRKKGFTLIEVLAVIIILGIIALISVPVVIGIINNARKGAFKASVQSIFRSYETYEAEHYFDVKEKISILDLPLTNKETFISGRVYKKEEITRVENVSNGSYCASGTLENVQIIDGDCGLLDLTPPVIENITSEVTTNSIKLYTIYKEEESFLLKHEYRIALEKENIEEKEWVSGDTLTGNLSTKIFTGLMLDTTYKIQVRLVNTSLENNTSEIKEILVTTNRMEKPVIELLTDREYATSKEVKLLYPTGEFVYEYSLGGQNWISVNEREKIVQVEENGTIRARIYDGTNYMYAENLTISGIDKTEPNVTIRKEVIENKNVLIATVEPESTISGYTYTWYKDGKEIRGEEFSSLQTGTSGVYQVKVTTGAGMEGRSPEKTIESFTITYDLTGGTGNIEEQIKIEDIPLKITNVIPEKEGYHFVGWRKTEENIIDYKNGEMYEENKSMTLSAIWSYYGMKIEDLYESIYVRNLTDGKLYSVSEKDYYGEDFTGNYDRPEGLEELVRSFSEFTFLNPSPYAESNKNFSIVTKENLYELSRSVSSNVWVSLFIRARGGTQNVEISNLKLNVEVPPILFILCSLVNNIATSYHLR